MVEAEIAKTLKDATPEALISAIEVICGLFTEVDL